MLVVLLILKEDSTNTKQGEVLSTRNITPFRLGLY